MVFQAALQYTTKMERGRLVANILVYLKYGDEPSPLHVILFKFCRLLKGDLKINLLDAQSLLKNIRLEFRTRESAEFYVA